MGKMIDGNALIMSLTDWWYSSFGQEETEESKAIKTVVDEVEKYVDGYPTYRGWIPVSERLPENSGCVLISIAGDIEFGAYDRQNSDWAIWRDGYWDEGKRADAWMPLPEPWKDGEEE